MWELISGSLEVVRRRRRRGDQGRVVMRIVHDASLAAWFGGAWMGSVGLNQATIEVDDHTQRTRVANAGWFRWAPVVAASVLAHTVTAALLGRLRPAFPVMGSGRSPDHLRDVRTGLTALAVLATLETGVAGERVVQGGDVPVASAVTPIRATPGNVANAQRRLRRAQWLVPIFTGSLWVVNAVQDRPSRPAA
jgi:hypothetical protein